jgi:hypothetical protein
MAAKSRSEIIGDIEDFIARNGGEFGGWYVGVAAAPRAKLQRQHRVKDKGDACIARRARDEYEAHEVAEYFRTTRGTRGPGGQPGEEDVCVYGYKIKSHTKP